jgi:hypothetical protein
MYINWKRSEFMKRVYLLLIILCLLNIGDYLTTMLAIGCGAIESNIITRYFISHNTLHYYKLIGIGLLCIYLIWSAKKDFKSRIIITRLLKWANVAYGIIVVLNIGTYFIQKNMPVF